MFEHLSGVLDAYPGWLAVACASAAVIAYILGCFNGAVIVSRFILRDDVRSHGSGNAGLTNFQRTFGGPLTAVVILSDVLKAVIAVLFSMWIFGVLSPELVTFGKYWAGLFCLLGHMFPCTFQFRGGKGILSGGAIAIMIDWRVAVVVWGGFLILAVLTRYVSLGSCWAGASFPFATWFVYREPLLTVLAIIIGGLILWKHRGNIQRLLAGTESKFSLHKKSASPPPKAPAAAAPPPEPAPDRAAKDVPAEAAPPVSQPEEAPVQSDKEESGQPSHPKGQAVETVAESEPSPQKAPRPKQQSQSKKRKKNRQRSKSGRSGK